MQIVCHWNERVRSGGHGILFPKVVVNTALSTRPMTEDCMVNYFIKSNDQALGGLVL